jgi:predicted O-linked N-acetylglucosamine transferase (SPINDLY family)
MNKKLSKQTQIDKYLHEGIRLHKKGKLKEAKLIFGKIVQDWPEDFEALHSLGTIEAQLLNFDRACELLQKATQINPLHSSTFFNLGLAQKDLKRFEDSIVSIKRAIQIEPENLNYYFDCGSVQIELKLFEDALLNFEKLIEHKRVSAKVYFYHAYCLSKLNQTEEAVRSLDQSIQLDSTNPIAYFNKGNELMKLQKPLEASGCFGMALAINPSYAEAYHNSGAALSELKQMQAASASYLKALELNPNLDFLFGTCLYQKLLMCDWDFLHEGIEYCRSCIENDQKVSVPFPAILFAGNDKSIQKITKIFAQSTYPKTNLLATNNSIYKNSKIRLAYYSSDFYNHATVHLIAKLFRDHDRNKFEIYGFSLSLCPHDQAYLQVAKSFDKFFDVSTKSDLDIVRMSRDLQVDIAIDLKGYTKHNRTAIFAEGCAPLQVNYLGYPGTMGAKYIDYIIADKVVIPESAKVFFDEKVVYLPNSYQVNDSTRVISNDLSSRTDHALPEGAFVFCCFNNNYKITPEIFDVWMRIVSSVEGSVLWLLEDNSVASENLYKESDKRGIDKSRIIFAKRVTPDLHLSRHRFADLFIDTSPCNAHTTASDALWAGLPVLTLKGNSFAGRVAASLLTALDVTELIAEDIQDYEQLAIEIALNPEKLKFIKSKIEFNKKTAPLFNTEMYTRHIESAYLKMYQLHIDGKTPEHIYVEN